MVAVSRRQKMWPLLLFALGSVIWNSDAFVLRSSSPTTERNGRQSQVRAGSNTETPPLLSREEELALQKQRLLGLLGPRRIIDPVLADPKTKDRIEITASPRPLASVSTPRSSKDVPFRIRSASGNAFSGSSGTYLDLLNPITPDQKGTSTTTTSSNSGRDRNEQFTKLMKQAIPYIPPPLRGAISTFSNGDYVPMRDLFTSPAVSFAYERGWRQGFERAGFPGPDTEARMAMEYFAPVIASVPSNKTSVVVDMSCATGLFTRRFAASGQYDRVLGCDYSESMLLEARRRIEADPKLSSSSSSGPRKKTSLDLVRLDVGRIPMQDASVDALHAGAAMHCWPDLDAAASEIYRVLRPGGRYFASTFLSTYFATLSGLDGQASTPVSQQAFQYFESIDALRGLLERGGFSSEKITIEVLGAACVIIRAEK